MAFKLYTMISKKQGKFHFLDAKTHFIYTLLTFVVVLAGLASCSEDKADNKIAVDCSKMPRLHETDITTVISDSGITRYRINTPSWDIYDKANQPYWEFVKGIYFEQFDKNMKVVANIHSLYARYNENERLWDLRGKVKMTNIQGELFETEHLYWNQNQERIYSDTIVKITQAKFIVNAIGFESNQSMTKYTFRKAFGPILTNDK